jgi:putative transposase
MDEEGLHPGRKSIRLENHDYAAPASYFVTVCTDGKRCLFGRVLQGSVELTELGRIARENWVAIPSHFANVNLHVFVVMPNHVHGIIEIGCRDGAQRAAPLPVSRDAKRVVQKGSLAAIVRSYKAAVTLQARRELGWKGEVWQRNYFERYLQDGQEFSDATRYVAENAMKWEWDEENAEAKSAKLKTEIDGAQHAAPLRGKLWS